MQTTTIEEKELLAYAENEVIESLNFMETESGRFSLYVKSTWRGDFVLLLNARKKPRLWVNLNTLLDYVRPLIKPDTPITITLTKGDENG
ncbi:hypothetical protein [Salmonella enterica]|uniref:hypothetical protein n=1 Tax=Salmonella enterica TaxID=28901 RepID=UPI003BD41E41